MLEVNYTLNLLKGVYLLSSPTPGILVSSKSLMSSCRHQAGALEALVATMKSHPDDPRVQSWSAYAAQRISSGDDAAGLKRQKKAKEARRVFMNH